MTIRDYSSDTLPSNYKELFEKVSKSLFEKTKRTSIEFDQGTAHEKDDENRLCSTKFGGIPYWPSNMKYPQNSKGQDLILLAQLNFAELPHLEKFPNTGILQFFSQNDYGDSDLWTDKSSAIAVVYHKNPDPSKSVNVEHTSLNLYEDDFPVHKVWYPKARIVETGINSSIEDYESLIIPMINDAFGEKWKSYNDLPRKLQDLYWDNECSNSSFGGHRCGGYPYGVQNDPTPYPNEMKNPVLLFQQDSQGPVSGDNIMWGDVGLCQFFISESDLKSLKFDKIYFDYQCY